MPVISGGRIIEGAIRREEGPGGAANLPEYHVTSYGFVGNGQSSSSADRAAIDNILGASTFAGGILVFPPGAVWWISPRYIITQNNVVLRGDAGNPLVITGPVDVASQAYFLTFEGTGSSPLQNVGMEHVFIDAGAWWDGTTRVNTGTSAGGNTWNTFFLAADTPGSASYPAGSALFILEDPGNPLAAGGNYTSITYNAATKSFSLSGDGFESWTVVPSAVTATSFTLPLLYQGVPSPFVLNRFVRVTAGTGAGSTATITAYDPATRVCTIDGWSSTQPNTSSTLRIYHGVPSSQAQYGILLAGSGDAPQHIRGVGRIGVYHVHGFRGYDIRGRGGHGKLDFRNAKHVTLSRLHFRDVEENCVNFLAGVTTTDQCEDALVDDFRFLNVGEGFDLAVHGFAISNGVIQMRMSEDEAFDCNYALRGSVTNVEVQGGYNVIKCHGAYQSFVAGQDMTSCRDLTFSNITAVGFRGAALAFVYGWSSGGNMTRQQANFATRNILLDNCVFRSTEVDPTAPVGAMGVWASSCLLSAPVPVDNVFLNNCIIEVPKRALLATFVRNLTASNCVFRSTTHTAVEIGYSTTYLSEQIRLNNCIIHAAHRGVDIVAGKNVWVQGCTLTANDNGIAARQCGNIYVAGCQFLSSGQRHFWLDLTTSNWTDSTWTGGSNRNHWEGENDVGIHVTDCIMGGWGTTEATRYNIAMNSSGTFRGFRFERNRVRAEDTASRSGVRFMRGGSVTDTVIVCRDNELDSRVANPLNLDTTLVHASGTDIRNDRNRVRVITLTDEDRTLTWPELDGDVLILNGTLTATRTITTGTHHAIPGKMLTVRNNTAMSLVFRVGTQTGVTLLTNTTRRLYCTGTDWAAID